MDTVKEVLQWFADNMFNEVAVLLGLIVVAGLWLQKKRFEEVVAGALRATVGMYALFAGIALFIGGLSAFQAIVSGAFGLDPPAATANMSDFLANQGGTIALVLTVGFLAHVAIVRIFKLKFVYLTGHLMFWMSVLVTASVVAAFGAQSQATLVAVGAAIVAVYWTLQPIYIARKMRKVIGSDEWGYGHTSSAACYLAAAGGKYVGDPEKHDTEKVKLPSRLSFFKDVNASTALVIGVIMLVAMAFASEAVRNTQLEAYNTANGSNLNVWVWGLVMSLKFAAGIAILLFGVRMFLAEVVPAFKGISDRLIPGARPALDCPTIFPKAPTAVMLGFLGSTAVFLVLMAVFASIEWIVIVPPMIQLFFPGGAAGVFGNAYGGYRGALLGGAINGAFLAVGQAVTWTLLGGTAPELATIADPDWYIMSWLIIFVRDPFAFTGFEQGFVTVFGWLAVAGLVFGVFAYLRHRGTRGRTEVTTPAIRAA